MNDEQLLRALGQIARDDDVTADAVALERLCAGTLDGVARAALEARARSDPQLAEAVRAYTPLDTARQAALLARVAAQVGAHRAAKPAPKPAPSAAPWRPSRRVRAGIAATTGLVATAAIVLVMIQGPASSPLPTYALEVTGAVSTTRGRPEARAAVRVSADTRLELVLRPESAVAGGADAIGVAAFLVRPGDVLGDWPATTERASTGALRVLLGPPPSTVEPGSELRVVVAPTERLQRDARSLALRTDEHGSDSRRFRVALAPYGEERSD